MNMAYGRLCVLAVLALAGCTSSPTPTPTPTPTPAAPSTTAPAPPSGSPVRSAGVTVERTGGFVGVDQHITVDPDGRWTYYRTRVGTAGGTPVRGRLNDDQLADLRALLADPKLGSEVGETSDCADGFIYTLVTGPTKVRWADCGTGSPETAMRVVDLLSTSTAF
jgi:hypothetical protein